MEQTDQDRPDDSNAPDNEPDSVREETAAVGERIKGATEEAVGDMTGDENLERKGERENEEGRDRQEKNDAV
jgi:uncharacterized protein YjbJ (UPF0337 family)